MTVLMTMMSSGVRNQDWVNLIRGIFTSSGKRNYNHSLNCNSVNSGEQFTIPVPHNGNTNSSGFFLING